MIFDNGQFRFDPQRFRIGLRTVKTGLAVFLDILLFQIMGWPWANIAALTTVFSVRQDFESSLHFGISRILGTAIGGFYAIIYFFIHHWLPYPNLIQLTMIPICAMLTIVTNVAFHNEAGVIGGSAAFFVITLSIPESNSIAYTLARVGDSFIGAFVAIFVNLDFKLLMDLMNWKKGNQEQKDGKTGV